MHLEAFDVQVGRITPRLAHLVTTTQALLVDQGESVGLGFAPVWSALQGWLVNLHHESHQQACTSGSTCYDSSEFEPGCHFYWLYTSDLVLTEFLGVHRLGQLLSPESHKLL